MESTVNTISSSVSPSTTSLISDKNHDLHSNTLSTPQIPRRSVSHTHSFNKTADIDSRSRRNSLQEITNKPNKLQATVDNFNHTENDDIVVLFAAQQARISQFSLSTLPKDYDTVPSYSEALESVVVQGKFQIYKMLGQKVAYFKCGHVVHPILPK